MVPIVVTAPLRGEYLALTSPGDKIPSHGTHEWGMTYAYDFICVKENKRGSLTWHAKSVFEYLLWQVKLKDTYGWGEPIYSPINGVVREVVNCVEERNRLHILSDIGLAIFHGLFFSYRNGKIHTLAGNYLIIEGENSCALIAHAKLGSIKPKVGDVVCAGECIAEIGHSGNSSAPHLHFQLMDRIDLKSAKGLPCCFASYEVDRKGEWESVQNSIPTKVEKIRFNLEQDKQY